MQSAVQKSAHFPQAQFAMLGILMFAITAYPKSLDQGVRNADKMQAVYAHCAAQPQKLGLVDSL